MGGVKKMTQLSKTDVLQRRPVLMSGTVPSPSPVKTPFCQSSVSLSALMCHSLVSFLAFVCLSCCAFACTNQGHVSEMYVQILAYETIVGERSWTMITSKILVLLKYVKYKSISHTCSFYADAVDIH